MNGITIIKEERERQIIHEGYLPNHDLRYIQGELEDAADAYYFHGIDSKSPVPKNWPWEIKYWKPTNDPIRNYAKAGALYLAEKARQLTGMSKGLNTVEDMDLMVKACAIAIDAILKEQKSEVKA